MNRLILFNQITYEAFLERKKISKSPENLPENKGYFYFEPSVRRGLKFILIEAKIYKKYSQSAEIFCIKGCVEKNKTKF